MRRKKLTLSQQRMLDKIAEYGSDGYYADDDFDATRYRALSKLKSLGLVRGHSRFELRVVATPLGIAVAERGGYLEAK